MARLDGSEEVDVHDIVQLEDGSIGVNGVGLVILSAEVRKGVRRKVRVEASIFGIC